ncbi:MAG: replicative DNA helicase [Deltaproteobacteria bacterium]|nr:replicative DNA helicase [Deltaproteobacteria bacterium]MBW2308044.1 replicative DNA helicase [Deltaproteobacteria bacterium]
MATDAALTKIPPQNIEAEQAVLGSILLDNEMIPRVVEVIGERDFYRDSHRKVFHGILELFERNEPADLITLTNILRDKNQLDEVGGPAFMASLVENVSTAANVEYHARIVKEKAILRNIISAATEIVSRGFQNSGNVDEYLDYTQQVLLRIAEQRIRPSFYPIKELIKSGFAHIEKLYERKEAITGVPTGFDDFDRLTAGLQKSDLVVVAGRPGMGKTTFALNVATYAAVRSHVPVVIFSLEMSREQLALRMLCSEARVDSSRVRTGMLSERDWPRLTTAAGILSEAPIYVDDTPGLTSMELRAKARRLRAEHEMGLIIVDYLQIMSGLSRSENRQQEISEISRSLKGLAREMDVPLLVLSQLNRAPEERKGRPQLADLRESGAIEQDADVVCLIYRPELYDIKTDEDGNSLENVAKINIAKQRNGPTGDFHLTFSKEFTRFDNYAPERAVF